MKSMIDFGVNEPLPSGTSVLMFSADWCTSCKPAKGFIENVLMKKHPSINFLYNNVTDNASLAEMFGVSSLPTLILIDDGEPKFIRTGSTAVQHIDKFLSDM